MEVTSDPGSGRAVELHAATRAKVLADRHEQRTATGAQIQTMATSGNSREEANTETEERDTTTGTTVQAGGRPSYVESTDLQEGRGNPASAMLWSPRKRTGQKRLLEVREEAGDESEAESGEIKLDEEAESDAESGEIRLGEEVESEEGGEHELSGENMDTSRSEEIAPHEQEMDWSREAMARTLSTT